jgi:hemolysin activation/secretion protein
LYEEHIGKDITLDFPWTLADAITSKYRDQGYFLTRAYVPEQDIKGGVITIKIIEGYIGQVDLS